MCKELRGSSVQSGQACGAYLPLFKNPISERKVITYVYKLGTLYNYIINYFEYIYLYLKG